MNGKKVICAGHVCLDITPVFAGRTPVRAVEELLRPGKLIGVADADIHTGGSVANTGLAMKILGNDVTLMGKIGRDRFGEIVRSVFSEYGCTGLLVDEQVGSSYSVVLAIPGVDRIFLHHSGANDSFVCDDVPQQALQQADLFHFGYPTLMKQMYRNDGEELIRLFVRAKQAGCATSLDLSAVDPDSEPGRADWGKILAGVLPYVDFFVPSLEELSFMLAPQMHARMLRAGGDVTDHVDFDAQVKPLAQRCLELGAGTVLIKCGRSGMFLKTAAAEKLRAGRLDSLLDVDAWGGREIVQPCYWAGEILSATGAGDVSIAAFLTAVLDGCPPAECISCAAAEGSVSVTAYDALSALRPLSELKAALQSGEIRLLADVLRKKQ
ncbi:MAG: carbohydrate kinase family protein [Clostridia bacterium]|nr:carbohydrate kinase family protein [Clostridia bacterium]